MTDADREILLAIYEETLLGPQPGLATTIWYGCDACGQIAAFCPIGFGRVPSIALPAKKDFVGYMEFFDNLPMSQSRRVSWDKNTLELCLESRDIDHLEIDFLMCGISVYVYPPGSINDMGKCYLRAATTSPPLTLADCPRSVRETLEHVVFPIANWLDEEHSSIRVEDYFDCIP